MPAGIVDVVPPADGRADGANESDVGGISATLHQLRAEQLGETATIRRVRLQQLRARVDGDDTLLRQQHPTSPRGHIFEGGTDVVVLDCGGEGGEDGGAVGAVEGAFGEGAGEDEGEGRPASAGGAVQSGGQGVGADEELDFHSPVEKARLQEDRTVPHHPANQSRRFRAQTSSYTPHSPHIPCQSTLPTSRESHPQSHQPPPPPVTYEEEGEKEFEVEKVLDVRQRGRRWEWRVRWVGYRPEDDTWEPWEHLQRAKTELRDFYRANPRK